MNVMVMGTLFVVATPIGNMQDMTPRAVDVLRDVRLIAAEDTRHSAPMLKQFGIETPLLSYHQHNRASRELRLIAELERGDVALISDAGTPAIADPGHELVQAAIDAGHRVVPIPGASSAIAAISASGLVPGPCIFLGFVARTGEERRHVLGKSLATGFPVVLFESPLRASATLAEIESMSPGRSGVVARELTKMHEEFRRGTIAELATAYAEVPPRGEVVLIIGEAPVSQVDADPVAIARSILDQGIKPSRAARELSGITGMEAAEAYALIRELGNSKGDS